MKEIIGKYKFKTKKLPHRIAIDEKEFIDEETIAEKSKVVVIRAT